MENKLGLETSPYLQQHKDNPVNWWPYCQEAFDRALEEDKPIFLSIGYSTCHWCHVMARESFSDPETADFMNKYFINIKMDREEHPGIDKAYQEMYQLLAQRAGGWPLSVYANADGSPFFIGTYFPKNSSFGLKSFMDVNKQIVDAWNNQREILDKQATNLVRGLRSLGEFMYNSTGKINQELYENEIQSLRSRFDNKYGGIGGAPKFPRISSLRFLIAEGLDNSIPDLIQFVRFTLHQMAKGGIYDQLGGGFARYSVDTRWLIPHFEKMLYDNAGLIQLGSELFAITGDTYIEWIIKDTIFWLKREMISQDGTFYSALNAESENQEGKFYVWQKSEIENILGSLYKFAELRFGITKNGNFKDPHHPKIKGMNVLSIVNNMQTIAKELDTDEDTVFKNLNIIRQKLFESRTKRIKPSTDTKIIVAWNALMIKSLFVTAELLNYEEAGRIALKSLEFIINNMIQDDKLLRVYSKSDDKRINREIDGVLSDYSFLISALIQAFEYTDIWDFIAIAEKLNKMATEKFFDEKSEVYFLNNKSETNLLGRVIQVSDDSMISGVGVMVENLFKLSKYLEIEEYEKRGKKLVEKFINRADDFPGSMDSLLFSAKYYLKYPTEIVIVNDEKKKLANAHFQFFLPRRIIYRWNNLNKSDGRPYWEVLQGRTEFNSTIFICKGMNCSLPISSIEGLKDELKTSN